MKKQTIAMGGNTLEDSLKIPEELFKAYKLGETTDGKRIINGDGLLDFSLNFEACGMFAK